MCETSIGHRQGPAGAAKSALLRRLEGDGFSEGYGSLLFLATLLGTDAEDLRPKNDEERFEWRGHLRGLRAALACLAIHDASLTPGEAAAVVEEHLAEAALPSASPAD
jgi:hypothetical protein